MRDPSVVGLSQDDTKKCATIYTYEVSTKSSGFEICFRRFASRNSVASVLVVHHRTCTYGSMVWPICSWRRSNNRAYDLGKEFVCSHVWRDKFLRKVDQFFYTIHHGDLPRDRNICLDVDGDFDVRFLSFAFTIVRDRNFVSRIWNGVCLKKVAGSK